MPEDSFFQTISPKDTTFFKSSDHLNTEGQKSAGPDYNNILQQMEISRIFSALAEPVIIYDASGSPVLANTAAVKMIGFDPTGMPWEEFIQKKALLYPNGRPVPFDKLPCKRALDGAIVHSEKFVRVNAKGEERIYEFNAVSLVRDEKIIGAVTVARDETESTRLMDQLETERTALQAIIHNAPEAIIVVDQECRIVMTNPAARQLYQQSPEGIMAGSMGPGYADFSPPYDPVDLPLARSVFHGEMIVDHEMAISLPNGLCRHILVNTAPIRNPRGEVTGAVGVFHDITQRKRERLELQRARTELEKRVEERTAELRHTVNTLREEIEERKKIENRLQDSQDNLRHLSHRMLHTLESDRQKIARELHDSLGASLAAIKFSLEEKLAQMPTNPPDDILSIESIVSYLTTTIKETKRISANLRPTILDDLGLLPTITWFCREFQSFYRNIRIEEKIRIREEEIDESMKIVIYRILQEAINNAAKHGNPNTINLVLTKKDSRVELTVDDDGNGFDLKDKLNSSDPMSGNGIQGMKERADICGGDFKILSHPGTGTRVHVSLPGHPYSAC
jgi:PAS domain S-box-containing protein